MNPLKSLMALGLALALPGSSFATSPFDSAGGNKKKLDPNSVSTPQPTADGSRAAADDPINAISAGIRAGSGAKDIGARFAQYLKDDGYFSKDYLAKTDPASVSAFQETVAKAVEQAVKAEGVDAAALYVMIGPGKRQPVWMRAGMYQALSGVDGSEWHKDFEEKMRCWRQDRGDAANCDGNEHPYGAAGAEDDETHGTSWIQGVTKEALAAAYKVYTDRRSIPELTAAIAAKDQELAGVGAGPGAAKAALESSSGLFNAADIYGDGAVQKCVVAPEHPSPQGGGCGALLSMKVVYQRDAKTGRLAEALTVCDTAGSGAEGSGCETMPFGAGEVISLAGKDWQVAFKGGQASVTWVGHSDIGLTAGKQQLEDALAAQVNEYADKGRGRVAVAGRNYIAVPYAHSVVTGYQGDDAVEAARGALMFFAADPSGKPLQPIVPMFVVDDTQGGMGKHSDRCDGNSDTGHLQPPATALGCAGLDPTAADVCNGRDAGGKPNADPKDFYYLVQDAQCNFVPVSCQELRTKTFYKNLGYAGIECGFPQPPDPPKKEDKPVAAGSKPAGSAGPSGASGAAAASGPPSPPQEKIETWTCSKAPDDAGKYWVQEQPPYAGFSPIQLDHDGASHPWIVFAADGTPGSEGKPSTVNNDRLCVDGSSLISAGGMIGDVLDAKDAEGHDYLEFMVFTAVSKWIPVDQRGGGIDSSNTTRLQWSNGTPIDQRLTYFIPPERLGSDYLATLDQSHLASLDGLAVFKFVQSKALESNEAEQMIVQLPKNASADSAYQLIQDGLSKDFLPAQNRSQFASSGDLAALQEALKSAFSPRVPTSLNLTLRWSEECGASKGKDNYVVALSADYAALGSELPDSENLLIHNCNIGGKFQSWRDYLLSQSAANN